MWIKDIVRKIIYVIASKHGVVTTNCTPDIL